MFLFLIGILFGKLKKGLLTFLEFSKKLKQTKRAFKDIIDRKFEYGSNTLQ